VVSTALPEVARYGHPDGVVAAADAAQFETGVRRFLERPLEADARRRLTSHGADMARLVAAGQCRPELAPGGVGWTPYGQVHSMTTAGAAIVLDAADTVRAWDDTLLETPFHTSGHNRRQVIQGVIGHNSYHTNEIICSRHMLGFWLEQT
jgi:hypothetical protein